VFRARAVREIDIAWSWWQIHRRDADAGAVDDAIVEAVRFLREYPDGAPKAADGAVHKIFLPTIEAFLFYRVRPRLRRVEVFRFRGCQQDPKS
jgi:hypothetical protein